MPLTAVQARQALPKPRQYKLADGKGLYLLVMPNGSKYWRLKYRIHGREKTFAIGTLDEVSLAEARDERDRARVLIKQGIDPTQDRKQKNEQAKLAADNSFESIAREWHQQKSENWSDKHAERVLNSLVLDVFPVIGKRPIAELKPKEILRAVRAAETRDAIDMAHRLLQRCSMIFRYAIITDRASYNPAADLKGALKTRKAVHHAALSRDALPDFLMALDDYEGHPVTRMGLQLVTLTFLRSSELRNAEWSEIDFDRAEWRVPGDRMKMGIEHIVPLSEQALDVLRDLREVNGQGVYIFTANNHRKPISENTLLFGLYRMGYKNKATVHGFRATASTILNESGFNRDAIERQLAHAEKDKVRAAYHRAEYLEERQRMMQWWADYLDSAKRGNKVIPIHTTKEA